MPPIPTTPSKPAIPPAAKSRARPRTVGFLLIPGFSLMSYASCLEPLRAANQLADRELYRWWHAAPADQPAVASSGTAVLPDFPLRGDLGALDLLLVCAAGNPAVFHDRRTFAWLRSVARRGVVIGGVSGGPFIMARAGLLSGRRCTVHWEHLPALQEQYPQLRLTRTLFEVDGDRITCSGGIAGLDMMIARIAQDHGYALGAAVSEWLLHTAVREGEGPQRMDLRFRLGIVDEKLLCVLRAMESHLEVPLSRAQLAALANVSLRQLERSFRASLGRGVHEYYLALRLRRARQLLRETSFSVLETAVATGFASASHFSRAFRRVCGFAPREALRTAFPPVAHRR
ncbi:MAG TPA: GlxA family transcriptional regulator [Steroidobacteraceae bacterium]